MKTAEQKKKDNAENAALRKRSGSVTYVCRLTGFLYDLLRDHLPTTVLEEAVRNSTDQPTSFCNGYLASYARDLAKRLKGEFPAEETKHVRAYYYDEKKNLLFDEEYQLSRMHAVGGWFIRDSIRYSVLDAHISRGKMGTALIEYMVVASEDRSEDA